jgi:hypothetical protein
MACLTVVGRASARRTNVTPGLRAFAFEVPVAGERADDVVDQPRRRLAPGRILPSRMADEAPRLGAFVFEVPVAGERAGDVVDQPRRRLAPGRIVLPRIADGATTAAR